MKPIHGKLMMATGILHSIVALLIYWDKWRVFFNKGFFNVSPHTVSAAHTMSFSDIGAEAALWFFVGGILFIVIGQLMHSLELKHGRLPIYVGWELLIVGAFFAWMAPESGFTLLIIPQAIYILLRASNFAKSL